MVMLGRDNNVNLVLYTLVQCKSNLPRHCRLVEWLDYYTLQHFSSWLNVLPTTVGIVIVFGKQNKYFIHSNICSGEDNGHLYLVFHYPHPLMPETCPPPLQTETLLN